MNDLLDKVKQFHELFNIDVGTLKGTQSLKMRQLRIKVLFEELSELAEASDVRETFYSLCQAIESDSDWFRNVEDGDNVDQIEELDALCDLQYVLNGTTVSYGMHEVFDKAFNDVHMNNMQKAHLTRDHAQQTLDIQLKKDPQSKIIDKSVSRDSNQLVFIVVNGSGKVIKPWNHKKVKLTL